MLKESAYAKTSYAYTQLQGEQLFILKVTWLVFQKKLCSTCYEKVQEHFRNAVEGKPALLEQRQKSKPKHLV